MSCRRSVGLLIESSNAYGRGLIRGITGYLRQRGNWAVRLEELARQAPPPSWMGHWNGDGIIARIEDERTARAIRRIGLPVVDVSAAGLIKDVARVQPDDLAISQSAVDHFLERGLRQLAFYGDPPWRRPNRRREHFSSILHRLNMPGHLYDAATSNGTGTSPSKSSHHAARWLRNLPKPVGILAYCDVHARHLLDVCRDTDIKVPDDVAVLGVGNDRLVCDLCTPPASSVIPNARRVGYVAAELLEGLMSGQDVGARTYRIEPRGIATRQSTDILAIDDPDVAAALRYIQQHACGGINVTDVLNSVPLSRRVLESKFRKTLRRTPHQEITRVRIMRVKQLLADTDLPLASIAERVGFGHVESLTVAFKRNVGIPPSVYRKTHANV